MAHGRPSRLRSVQPPPLPPPHPRLFRAALLGVCTLLAVASLYVVARETSVFAIRTVRIDGAPEALEQRIRAQLSALRGASLVALDSDELSATLRRLPSVREVEVDRAFPHTLQLIVHEEEELAVVRAGSQAWLVSRSGRIVSELVPGGWLRLPRIWLATSTVLEPGAWLTAAQGQAELGALAHVHRLGLRPLAARKAGEDLIVVLRGGGEIHLGDGHRFGQKLSVLRQLLATLSSADRGAMSYIDVSLPERPVVGFNSQLST